MRNHLTNLALAPVRLAAAVLTAAVTDRLDALAFDANDTGDVLSELIERIEDLEAMSAAMRTDDPGYLDARGRIRQRHADKLATVVA